MDDGREGRCEASRSRSTSNAVTEAGAEEAHWIRAGSVMPPGWASEALGVLMVERVSCMRRSSRCREERRSRSPGCKGGGYRERSGGVTLLDKPERRDGEERRKGDSSAGLDLHRTWLSQKALAAILKSQKNGGEPLPGRGLDKMRVYGFGWIRRDSQDAEPDKGRLGGFGCGALAGESSHMWRCS